MESDVCLLHQDYQLLTMVHGEAIKQVHHSSAPPLPLVPLHHDTTPSQTHAESAILIHLIDAAKWRH